MKWNGFDTDPTLFQPVSAKEIKDDGTVLDVAAWREDITARAVSQEQSRNGQTHKRVYDPTSEELQKQILEQLKEMNFHLRTITDENYED
jgi:hypothetical protein